jgi:hypothetical protein
MREVLASVRRFRLVARRDRLSVDRPFPKLMVDRT